MLGTASSPDVYPNSSPLFDGEEASTDSDQVEPKETPDDTQLEE
jgi:hypothetical protein